SREGAGGAGSPWQGDVAAPSELRVSRRRFGKPSTTERAISSGYLYPPCTAARSHRRMRQYRINCLTRTRIAMGLRSMTSLLLRRPDIRPEVGAADGAGRGALDGQRPDRRDRANIMSPLRYRRWFDANLRG